MNRTLKLALLSVLSAAMFVPAMAQDNFPNVPENHWAYEALENMKREGILVGYLDGLYRGSREATRYEMAVAINAVYQKLKGMTDGLDGRIKELEDRIGSGDGGDMKEMRDALAGLRRDVDGMKSWGDDVAALKRMAETFEKELASLGVDVEAMKKDLAGIEARVKKLEDAKFPVEISGDANIFVAAGNSRNGAAGMTKDGRIVGVNVQGAGFPDANLPRVGLTEDVSVYHEFALNLKGTNEEGPQWNATFVQGNLSGFFPGGPVGFGNQSQRQGGFAYREGGSELFIQNFQVAFDTSLVGVPFNAKVGRLGAQLAPQLFKRADVSPYYNNARWDNGDWLMDGAVLSFNFGAANLTLLGGKNNFRQSNSTNELQPLAFRDPFTGATRTVDRTLGAQLGFPIGKMGDIKLAYLFHDTNTTGINPANSANRLNVYGAEVNLMFDKFALNGQYGKSIPTYNTSNIGQDNNNQFALASLSYDGGNFSVKAGYRRIQGNYAAAGSWKRIGTYWSPTGISDINVGLMFKASDAISLSYWGAFGETINAQAAGFGAVTGLGVASNVDYQTHNGELAYRVNDAWTASLGYEDVQVKVAGPDIRQRWATLGLGYKMGENSMLKLAYEYGSVQNQTFRWGTGRAGDYRGGFLTTQLSIRF